MAEQRDWEFCTNCHVMFFNGYPDKGKCPGGGGHQHHPDAFRFVLPHNVENYVVNPAVTLRAVADQGRFIEVTGTGFTANQAVKIAYHFSTEGAPDTTTSGENMLTSNGAGSFVHRIPVTLGEIGAAQILATDIASGIAVEGSIG